MKILSYKSSEMHMQIMECEIANGALHTADTLLKGVQSHNDWTCSERKTIIERMDSCRKTINKITEDHDSLLSVLKTLDAGWEDAESQVIALFKDVDSKTKDALVVPANAESYRGNYLVKTLFRYGVIPGFITTTVVAKLGLVPFNAYIWPFRSGLNVSTQTTTTHETNTNANSNATSNQPGNSAPMTDEQILNEIQNRYSNCRANDGSTKFKSRCPQLVNAQLKELGVFTDGVSGNGKDLANNILKKGTTSTGYTPVAYNSLDDVINQNNGSVTNVVLSFNAGGNFTSKEYGHTMLISKIENGKVYFIDNCSWNCDGGVNNGQYKAQCWTVEKFKSMYFKKGTNSAGIVHLQK